MAGWIKLHRKLLNNPLWIDCNPNQKVVMVTLLLMANHEPKKWIFKGEEYQVNEGEMITSLKSISDQTGLTINVIRKTITKLEKYGFCTSKSTNKNRLITIENWGKYQSTEEEGTSNGTSKEQARNKQGTTNKNDKNYKNDKKEDIYTQFVDGFHIICPSFSKVLKITETRKRAIKNAINDHGLETVETVLKKAEASDFLTGRSTDYKASFDWILKPSNFIKILEGNYDNRSKPNDPISKLNKTFSAIDEYERMKNEL